MGAISMWNFSIGALCFVHNANELVEVPRVIAKLFLSTYRPLVLHILYDCVLSPQPSQMQQGPFH